MFTWPILRRHPRLGEILTNEKIDPISVSRIEQLEFGGEGSDPPETLDGIKYLLSHGTVLKPENVDTFAESISLDKLLGNDTNTLPPKSPLRMIVENDRHNRVLRNVRDLYPDRQNYHYSHGVVVVQKGQGYGSALFKKRLKLLVGENELMFGFIMAYPPNIPAIRMALRNYAVIDKLQGDVYEPGTRYFRWVYDRSITFGGNAGAVSLEDANYIQKIAPQLNAGFVGTRFKDNSIVFNRRI